MVKEYYKLLELTDEEAKLPFPAFKDVVKKQYRKLCVKFHPDKNLDKSEAEQKKAEEQFKKVSEAYETLSDETKKRNYDMYGTTGNRGFGNFHGFEGFDADEMMQDIFERFTGRRRGRQPQDQQFQGTDVIIRIKLKIDDVVNGCKKKYKFKRQRQCSHCDGGELVTCPKCQGRGTVTMESRQFGMFMQQTSVCPDCHGQGKWLKNSCTHCGGQGTVEAEETVEVNIPKGLVVNNQITLKGYGHEIPRSMKGRPGDLHVVISEIECDGGWKTADGQHFIKEQVVSIFDIITGKYIELFTPLKQKINIHIPAKTGDGHQLGYDNQGRIQSNIRYSNIVLTIKHKYPDQLSSKELKMIDELKRTVKL